MTRYTLKKDGVVVAAAASHVPGQVAKWLAMGLTVEDSWTNLPVAAETPATMDDIRAIRNRLLDSLAWTVSTASPLSLLNQLQWETYLLALHAITVGLTDPSKAVWPTQPALVYA